MSKKILQSSNKIIVFIMALLGFTVGCKDGPFGGISAAYGTPHANFVAKGNIVSANNNTTIKGIRVIAKWTFQYPPTHSDTVLTDATGLYISKISSFPDETKVNLNFTDVDGVANGSFQPLDTLVTFTNPKFTGGDGHWDHGTVEKVMNIKMKPKE